MKRLVTALSPQTEIAIVLLCAFGIPLAYSLLMALHVFDVPAMSDARLWRTVAFESIMVAGLGALLYARRWTLDRFGIGTPTLQDLIDGAGLLVVAYLIPAGLLAVLPPDIKQSVTSSGLLFAPGGISLPLVGLTSIVNPIFEEVFVVGYVFAVLGRASPLMAINVSIALRFAYHLYQGPAAVIFILPLAVVFAWWYSTRPSLWPLLIAHAALDFIGLSQHVG
jgi:membrane protease YdiL (CAAX protease family)